MKEQVWIDDDDEIVVREDVFNDRIPKQQVKEAIKEAKFWYDENGTSVKWDKIITRILGLED